MVANRDVPERRYVSYLVDTRPDNPSATGLLIYHRLSRRHCHPRFRAAPKTQNLLLTFYLPISPG